MVSELLTQTLMKPNYQLELSAYVQFFLPLAFQTPLFLRAVLFAFSLSNSALFQSDLGQFFFPLNPFSVVHCDAGAGPDLLIAIWHGIKLC